MSGCGLSVVVFFWIPTCFVRLSLLSNVWFLFFHKEASPFPRLGSFFLAHFIPFVDEVVGLLSRAQMYP